VGADVSVIIASRNRLWSLPKAVDSCRSKRLNVQIIVVDDGSTDGTAEWLQRESDVVAVQADGWGKPWAIHRASPLIEGSYVRFLDSDDWLNPGANEVQFAIAEREQADVVVSGTDIYQEDVLVRSVPWQASGDFISQMLGEGNSSHYSSFLFRRGLIGDIPHRTHFPASDFASRDDRCFMLEVALRKPRIAECEMNALCYRRHHDHPRLQFKGGLSGIGTHIQHLYVYRQILRLLESRGELSLRRRRAAIRVLWPLAHWIARYDIEEAAKIAEWIAEMDPEFSPPEPGMLGLMYRTLGFRKVERLLNARRILRRSAGRLWRPSPLT
jgi:glycosyltransferase involved in cell wall biosynthesis